MILLFILSHLWGMADMCENMGGRMGEDFTCYDYQPYIARQTVPTVELMASIDGVQTQ